MFAIIFSSGAFAFYPQPTSADEAAEREFFESRIRPVLVEHCYECHNSIDTTEGGLAVDHRDALLKGGDRGAALVAGKSSESRLIAVLRHEIEGLEMPNGGAKLDDAVIADFERWIDSGAYDPRDKPPSAEEVGAATAWESVFERRKQWWSLQSIRAMEPPIVDDLRWGAHPIDRFIFDKLHSAGLKPSDPAKPTVLVRRLYFNLTGLPPSRDEAKEWARRISSAPLAERDTVVAKLVDELLDSPRYGERWARHWMDWIRYAESHGSEGDPRIANAWHYRDYLIRAMNLDVPISQLIEEHVAGDLLAEPRLNRELGINESVIGPAHWRMVFHGYSPTDALDEKVRFIDDQINVFSKAFLGLTVSCARCHDHKFDAISQADYYALFGVLASCRPGRTVIDLPDRLARHRQELSALKPRIRAAIAEDWLVGANELSKSIAERRPGDGEQPTDPARVGKKDKRTERKAKDEKGKEHDAASTESILDLIHDLRKAVESGADFASQWQSRIHEFRQQLEALRASTAVQRWDLSDETDYHQWYRFGTGLPGRPHRAGEFAVATDDQIALLGIYPSGVYSHSISTKAAARLTSRDIHIGSDDLRLWLRVIGDGAASLRYVVQDYPRDGTTYPVDRLANRWRWQQFDLSYWKGDDIHIELATAADAPLLVRNQPRSWFGIRDAQLLRHGDAEPDDTLEYLVPVLEQPAASQVESLGDLVELYALAVTNAIKAWSQSQATDEQALLLDACLREGLLPNDVNNLPTAAPLLREYRRMEQQIPVPTRVPSLDESIGRDQPLLVRGNHTKPGDPVARRFLEALDATPYKTAQSGRLELAANLLAADNPLTRRVMVNRVWHHLFGQGIVSTPDNFGKLGETPSHPELLDWLALRMERDNWSLKNLVRLIVTSQVWQLSSRAPAGVFEIDPTNRLLSHAHVRRMEAEAIRDQVLMVAGQLQYEAPDRPVKGAVPARSIYVAVRRNSLDPFLRAFDFPEPFGAVGRRSMTNLPAQSLTMLNDPRISKYATAWAERVVEQHASDRARVEDMFLTAFGRAATEPEVNRSLEFLGVTRRRADERRRQVEELRVKLAGRRALFESITTPVRQRLLAEQRPEADKLPEPISRWEFDGSARDQFGNTEGRLINGARIEDGALVVANGGYMTAPLRKDVRAKTLEAWVQLDNLYQRGGGVITVQTPNGVIFDSIVFAEKTPRRWLAGSNDFARTEPFSGPAESEAADRPVHLAMVYHSDGRIEAYRNGKLYGRPYQAESPTEFKASEALVSFGIRHLPAGKDTWLFGKILRAQLYDRALSAEEVAATSNVKPDSVSQDRVLAALAEEQRTKVNELTKEIVALETRLRELGPLADEVGELLSWSELARAMFMFKEFIYVR